MAVVKLRLGYDDLLDVFGIHGVGGIVGAIGTGVFTSSSSWRHRLRRWRHHGRPGLFADRRGAITIVWCGVVSAILYKIVDAVIGLRPTPEAQREGLDLSSHGEVAYHS